MTTWTLPTYTWRGRTYKTINGICRKVLDTFPHASVGFDADYMHVSWRGVHMPGHPGQPIKSIFFRIKRGDVTAIEDAACGLVYA